MILEVILAEREQRLPQRVLLNLIGCLMDYLANEQILVNYWRIKSGREEKLRADS